MGAFLLVFGLSWIYDIKLFLDENNAATNALDRVIEIGPYSGDIGVNIIGTAFVLVSFIVFIKIVFPIRTESLVTDEAITCLLNGELKYEFTKNDIEWVDVSLRGIYGTRRITIKLKNGEETDIQMIYFINFSRLKKCLEKYNYPKRYAT